MEEEGGEEEDDPGPKVQDRLNEEVDPNFIAATGLWLRYHCVPFKAIRDLVEEFFGIQFTANGIRKLLYRYGGWIVKYARQFEYSYRMGRIWHADEIFVKSRRSSGSNSTAYQWLALDRKTNVVTTYMSRHRSGDAASHLLNRHYRKLDSSSYLKVLVGEGKPYLVIRDGAKAYSPAIEEEAPFCTSLVAHIRGTEPEKEEIEFQVPLQELDWLDIEEGSEAEGETEELKEVLLAAFEDGVRITNNLMEGINSLLRRWARSFRGFKWIPRAKRWLHVWEICYNFLEPQKGLGEKTPAEAAGIDLELGSDRWLPFVRKAASYG